MLTAAALFCWALTLVEGTLNAAASAIAATPKYQRRAIFISLLSLWSLSAPSIASRPAPLMAAARQGGANFAADRFGKLILIGG